MGPTKQALFRKAMKSKGEYSMGTISRIHIHEMSYLACLRARISFLQIRHSDPGFVAYSGPGGLFFV